MYPHYPSESFVDPNPWEKIPEKATVQDVISATINNNNAGLMWKHRARSCEAWVKDVEKQNEK